ncbi:MAG: pyrroline-5-carboxylate reductase [Coriobacteriales bacterium]|nr:pyrroline-5-carboxylate reductase [Coriobacteriales bacterium]
MGEAIVHGLVLSGALDAGRIVVAEPNETRRTEFSAAHAVRVVADGADALAGAGIVILAVKPQVIDPVLSSLAAHIGDALVVSIAAGITTARLESLLPSGTAVVRVMPNTPAMVGEGMTVISGGTEATSEDVELARRIFAALGEAVVIDEAHQDAATAISGSGPAYMALIVDALARAGVRQGLTREVAQRLAVQTMKGTATLIEESGLHPEALIDQVASPGGTTIAALEALEKGRVRSAIMAAVDAAAKRAKELG